MKIKNYLKWERLLRDRDYKSLVSLDLEKIFVFFILARMHQEGIVDEAVWSGLAKKLDNVPLDDWERIELSLVCPLKEITSCEVDSVLEKLVSAAREKSSNKTVVHVHVPKAAGTSVNTAFREMFYHGNISLPGNNTPLALRFAFDKLIGHVPFLSTGHLPLDWLLGEDIGRSEGCRFFMVHRDHGERINSMRNQIVSSVLIGRFFDRPYAYDKQFYFREMINRYCFPVKNENLMNTMSASLSADVDDAISVMQKTGVEVIRFEVIKKYIKEQFDIDLKHGRKNRTRNLSKYMIDIPSNFYAVDKANFR